MRRYENKSSEVWFTPFYLFDEMPQCVSLLSRCYVFTTVIAIHWTNNKGLVFSSFITVQLKKRWEK